MESFLKIIWTIFESIMLGAFIYLIIFIAIYIIYHMVSGRDMPDFKSKTTTIFLVLCLILALSYVTAKEYWGTDTIGALYSRSEFTTKYYVQLFPDGSESKNYLVPADLWMRDGGLVILKVYWPNGGYTTFDRGGDADPEGFYKDRLLYTKDDEDREWTIVLTNSKVID